VIIGTGIDLVDIPRFERSMTRTPRLMQRLFAPSEQRLRLASLAARYAAKEALIKALGGSDGVHWTEIEVARQASGAPRFALSGSTAAAVAARGIRVVHLSMSHDGGLATAHVIAEGVVPDAGADRPGADQPGADRAGAGRPGARRAGADQAGVGRPGADQPGVDQPGADRPGAHQPEAGRPGTPSTGSPAAGTRTTPSAGSQPTEPSAPGGDS
jgi:holo-[acyl-carrier protein] synthase